jgi:SAM-dependent methyltransferase/methyltransferase-like protein
MDPGSNEALVQKYDAVGSVGRSNPLSHPDALATAATLHGLSPPAVRSCRVLDVGCGDGANLLPMAAALPDARFVGCDLSPRAISAAREAVAQLGLANVTLVEGDLRELPDAFGPFDYIIAHGLYSWVPADVRDALLALAAERLSPAGLVFVSYNVYPGCHVRQAAWETLRFHSEQLEGARARLDAARALAAALAEAGRAQEETDALLRREFARIAAESDSALYHDDLAVPNDPVYFHQFAAHVERHGLAFVCEAKLFHSAGLGMAPKMQSIVSGLGRLDREQYLDFACLRRFRQSVLCRAGNAATLMLAPANAATLYVAASFSLMRAAAQGKPLLNPLRPPLDPAGAKSLRNALDAVLEIAPRALPVAELESRLARDEAMPAQGSLLGLLLDACLADELQFYVHPPRLTELASQRPLASAVARWQARRGATITNLRHETMQMPDPSPRAVLALLDGTRDLAALDADAGTALGTGDAAARRQRIDEYVRQFGRLGLLIG